MLLYIYILYKFWKVMGNMPFFILLTEVKSGFKQVKCF